MATTNVEERAIWGEEDMVVSDCGVLLHACGAAWMNACVIALRGVWSVYVALCLAGPFQLRGVCVCGGGRGGG